MAELIREYLDRVRDAGDAVHTARCYAEERADGKWEAWLEFWPEDEKLAVRRTPRETTQSDRAAVEYWASGIEPTYIEGAFERAQ